MSSCIWCMQPFEPGEKVRSIHPTTGLMHPQYHIFPDGANMFGDPARNVCVDEHEDEHVHEGCAQKYCTKVGLAYDPGLLELPTFHRLFGG